jgi:GH24 family phage-related lysozyme (muramidase)
MTPTRKQTAAVALAAAIAAPAEGLRQYAYYDPPGILTVCAGHTGPDVVLGKKYSLDECKALFSSDMLKAVRQVDECHPGLPQHVLAAFADAAYNIGATVACDKTRSTAARLLAQGRLEEACNQLPTWDKARVAGMMVSLPGLAKRRAKEQHLCLTGEPV